MLTRFEQIVFNGLHSPLKKNLILLGTLIAFILSIMMLPGGMVLAKMLPGKNSNTFSIYVDLPSGSSIEQTRHVTDCVAGLLQKEREITDIEIFLGMGSPLDFAGLIKGSHFKNSENLAEVVVNLTKKHGRDEPSYLMVQRVRPQIQSACEGIYANSSIKFVEPPAGPPVLAAVVAEIYGSDDSGIEELAGHVAETFRQTPGLVDVDIIRDERYKMFEVRVNSVKIAKSGLNIKQVNDILYLAFEGMQIAVKNSKEYDDQIPIFLTLQPDNKKFSRSDKEAIETRLSGLKLMNQQGMMVPITEVVEIVGVVSNPMITTKNLHKMTNVTAETDMVSQVYPLIDARNAIIEHLSSRYDITQSGLFNLELTDKTGKHSYSLVWDGEMKVTLDTFAELGAAFIAALVLIFLLMVVYYKSFALSGIVLLGSFLSIIGVILGHWIMDLFTKETFFLTATSLIGFIALIGISSRNSLLLLDFTRSLMHDRRMQKREAIAHATATRAKPIFLTAAAIILASTLLAGDAVFGGLGVALIFGTVAAIVVSLIVVPILIDNIDLYRHFQLTCDIPQKKIKK